MVGSRWWPRVAAWGADVGDYYERFEQVVVASTAEELRRVGWELKSLRQLLRRHTP